MFKNGHWRELFTLLDFQPEQRTLVIGISAACTHQNRKLTVSAVDAGIGGGNEQKSCSNTPEVLSMLVIWLPGRSFGW